MIKEIETSIIDKNKQPKPIRIPIVFLNVCSESELISYNNCNAQAKNNK